MTKKKEVPAADAGLTAGKPAGEGADLDQLRQILFGNQSRAIEERLDDLERRLETVRRDAHNELSNEVSALRRSNEDLNSSLTQRINQESEKLADTRKELQALQRSMAEDLNRVQHELTQELANQSKALQEKMESIREDLTERMLAKQAEARQRDDALRQELLALSSWLDNSKTSRMHLGQMLAEVGQRLQENGDSGPMPVIDPTEGNDHND